MVVIYGVVFTLWPDYVKVLISTNEINFVGVVMGVYASILIVYLSKLIRKAPLLEYLGKNSLVFYFLSGALPVVGSMIIKRFFADAGVFGLIAVYLFSVLCAWFASIIIDRYLSWLWDLRKVKRFKAKE